MQILTRTDLSKGASPLARFYLRVRKTRGCWYWTGYSKNGRYGHFMVNGRMRPAHVQAYELFIGPVVQGLRVLHSCDNTKCVNPKHLWLGTMKDNMQDMLAKGRCPNRSAIVKASWKGRREKFGWNGMRKENTWREKRKAKK